MRFSFERLKSMAVTQVKNDLVYRWFKNNTRKSKMNNRYIKLASLANFILFYIGSFLWELVGTSTGVELAQMKTEKSVQKLLVV